MSLRVFVDGKREDVERFFNEILEPEFGRLRRDDLFRVTENDLKYREKKTKDTVERQIRGYCPVQCWEDSSELFEKYGVEKGEPKRIGEDFKRVTGVQVKIGLTGFHFEIKLFYDEFIAPKGDRFVVDKDTGIYTNPKGSGSRHVGGHFIDPEE